MIQVVKRDGSKEKLDIEKIHRVVSWACEGISGVSPSNIELKSNVQFYNNIPTKEIHGCLIKSAADLISEDTPNYQYVAGRLVNYQLRKDVYGEHTPIRLYDLIVRNVKAGFYSKEILTKYTEAEIDRLDKMIDHDRDFDIIYAGMEQLRSKYLVRNRVTGQVFETPQIAFMMISAILFSDYKENRMSMVKDYYNGLSTFDFSLPTPIMAGVRTPEKQYSSCVLIESGDSISSITETASSIVDYASRRAGIGVGIGAIRAIGSPVRNGSISHAGVAPFVKLFQAALKSCSQGGIRNASATVYYPIWHYEVEDLLVLKNSKGIEENRARHMDYGVQFNKLFYERLINGGEITLFSPHDVPDLYQAFYGGKIEEFSELYEKYERSRVRKKTIPAIELFSAFVQERKDTGRIYLMNIDHANDHGSFVASDSPIKMSNLCCVSGNTRLMMIDEKGDKVGMTIGELADEVLRKVDEEDYYWYTPETLLQTQTSDRVPYSVLSHTHYNGKTSYSKIKKLSLSRRVADVLNIKTDSGVELVCTPDHLIYTSNRGYIEAQHLQYTDKLLDAAVGEVSVNSVTKIKETEPVYDIETECSNFFANGLLVHNCEITLPTKPMEKPGPDDQSEIALCILSAINWGKIKDPSDFERPCELVVRGLDAVIDKQSYPILAAERSTKGRRSLGVGIINFAYWMAKNDLKYQDISEEGLAKIHEYMEAFSYYLIKASNKLAIEFGACSRSSSTKYAHGVVPIDTYKRDVDELVPPTYKMDWDGLRHNLTSHGIRNSTLMAIMPSETSSQLSNATNGIEPPRAYVSVKQSKDGVLKQVVPEYRRLKNKYDLLWDQKNPIGYLKIAAVMQKFIDQAISVNTSYNPKFYDGGVVPMSEMIGHILMHYKYGGKTLYYNNTFDGSGELDAEDKSMIVEDAAEEEQTDCDSCKI